MKKFLYFITAGLIMSACSNSGSNNSSGEWSKPNEVIITNDLENAKGVIPGWMNENTVIALNEFPAHSGGYACLTNDSLPYSYYYKELIKNIKSENPKIATFSGWVYTTVANPNFAIICSVNANNEQYDWKAVPLDKELSETGKWVEFTASFYFDSKPLKPEQEIGIFAWNQSKMPVYLDDLKVTFTY